MYHTLSTTNLTLRISKNLCRYLRQKVLHMMEIKEIFYLYIQQCQFKLFLLSQEWQMCHDFKYVLWRISLKILFMRCTLHVLLWRQ